MRVLLHLAGGVPLGLLCPLLGRARQRRILQRWCSELLQLLHIRLQTQGQMLRDIHRPGLVVANHSSWLDVIALSAVAPERCVTGSGLRFWPLAGWAWRWSDRPPAADDSARLCDQITARLRGGESVILFPEGAASAGKLPGHFHSILLQSAIDCQVPVRPIAIRYHDRYGRPSRAADIIGTSTLPRSLWRILRSPDLHVTLTGLTELSSAGATRRRLARDAHASISLALRHPVAASPQPSDPCRDGTEPALYSLMLPSALHPHTYDLR